MHRGTPTSTVGPSSMKWCNRTHGGAIVGNAHPHTNPAEVVQSFLQEQRAADHLHRQATEGTLFGVLGSATHHDLAQYIKHELRSVVVCTSLVANGVWYVYQRDRHRWAFGPFRVRRTLGNTANKDWVSGREARRIRKNCSARPRFDAAPSALSTACFIVVWSRSSGGRNCPSSIGWTFPIA